MHSAQRTMHSIRGCCLALLLALLVGCATPDRYHDLRNPDPVEATTASGVFSLLAEIVYFLGSWLGPMT